LVEPVEVAGDAIVYYVREGVRGEKNYVCRVEIGGCSVFRTVRESMELIDVVGRISSGINCSRLEIFEASNQSSGTFGHGH
jgi:hypothetical protein